jgi:hypothetical protein
MTTVEQARQAIVARQADIRAGTAFSFAVLAAADGSAGDLVGSVSLRGLGGAVANGEVGYWVAAAARGRGVAPRALRAMCHWAFGSSRFPALERLRLIHAVGNEASCRGRREGGVRPVHAAPAAGTRVPSCRAPAYPAACGCRGTAEGRGRSAPDLPVKREYRRDKCQQKVAAAEDSGGCRETERVDQRTGGKRPERRGHQGRGCHCSKHRGDAGKNASPGAHGHVGNRHRG